MFLDLGNGKYHIKEPQELAKKAMKQLDEAITLSSVN